MICMSPENKILLVQGRRSGKWSFPKGHLESSETSIECARRELLEEAGVNLQGVTPTGCHKLSVGHYYTFEMAEEEAPKIRDANEISKADWVHIDEIGGLECNVDVNAFLDKINRRWR